MAQITVNRQSSIRISAGATVYFDPWEVMDYVADADVIFLTHDHYDHYSAEDVRRLRKDDTVIVAPSAMVSQVNREVGGNAFAVEPGREYSVNGITFSTVASYNRNKDFHPKGKGWCGYVVSLAGQRYYVVGDSDATEEAAAVQCDVLLLPIGGHYTMDHREAAELTAKIKPDTVIPTHYGDIVGDRSLGRAFAVLVSEKAPGTKVELLLHK